MDRREQRVREAVDKFAVASAALDFGRWFVIYEDGVRIEAPALFERARMALRDAVILMEANHG